MFQRNGVTYEFHHMGYVSASERPDERFSRQFGMYTSDGNGGLFPFQWHRFTQDSQIHPLLKTLPHAAFKVSDLDRAVGGKHLLLGPYEPIEAYRVAIIEEGGIPIELIETSLSDQELWERAWIGERSSLYE